MIHAWSQKKGFTIVELLITIVVIGILVGITLISYNGISQKSRDSRRDSDITQIKLSLEKYHADKGSYPAACTDSDGNTNDDISCDASQLKSYLTGYATTVPQDPSAKNDATRNYQYVRGSVDPTDPSAVESYGILVRYESKATCIAGLNVKTSWFTATYPSIQAC